MKVPSAQSLLISRAPSLPRCVLPSLSNADAAARPKAATRDSVQALEASALGRFAFNALERPMVAVCCPSALWLGERTSGRSARLRWWAQSDPLETFKPADLDVRAGGKKRTCKRRPRHQQVRTH